MLEEERVKGEKGTDPGARSLAPSVAAKARRGAKRKEYKEGKRENSVEKETPSKSIFSWEQFSWKEGVKSLPKEFWHTLGTFKPQAFSRLLRTPELYISRLHLFAGQVCARERVRRGPGGEPHPGAAGRDARQGRAVQLRRVQRGGRRREQRAVPQRQV